MEKRLLPGLNLGARIGHPKPAQNQRLPPLQQSPRQRNQGDHAIPAQPSQNPPRHRAKPQKKEQNRVPGHQRHEEQALLLRHRQPQTAHQIHAENPADLQGAKAAPRLPAGVPQLDDPGLVPKAKRDSGRRNGAGQDHPVDLLPEPPLHDGKRARALSGHRAAEHPGPLEEDRRGLDQHQLGAVLRLQQHRRPLLHPLLRVVLHRHLHQGTRPLQPGNPQDPDFDHLLRGLLAGPRQGPHQRALPVHRRRRGPQAQKLKRQDFAGAEAPALQALFAAHGDPDLEQHRRALELAEFDRAG